MLYEFGSKPVPIEELKRRTQEQLRQSLSAVQVDMQRLDLLQRMHCDEIRLILQQRGRVLLQNGLFPHLGVLREEDGKLNSKESFLLPFSCSDGNGISEEQEGNISIDDASSLFLAENGDIFVGEMTSFEGKKVVDGRSVNVLDGLALLYVAPYAFTSIAQVIQQNIHPEHI